MLQDIAPHTYHVEFTPAEPQPADLLLIYGPQGVLSAADALRLPVRADFPDIAVHFAFRLDDRAVFLAREPVEAPEGTNALPRAPHPKVTSASTVGFPWESITSLPIIFVILQSSMINTSIEPD